MEARGGALSDWSGEVYEAYLPPGTPDDPGTDTARIAGWTPPTALTGGLRPAGAHEVLDLGDGWQCTYAPVEPVPDDGPQAPPEGYVMVSVPTSFLESRGPDAVRGFIESLGKVATDDLGLEPEDVVVETRDGGRTWVATPPGAPAYDHLGFLMVGSSPRGRTPAEMRAGSGATRLELRLPRNPGTELLDSFLRAEARDARERRLASERAASLLESHLDPAQSAEYREKRWFHVTAKSGTRYRIAHGVHNNVTMLAGDGSDLKRLCAQCKLEIPAEDQMLAQKLWIEADEDGFLRTANATPPGGIGLDTVFCALIGDERVPLPPVRHKVWSVPRDGTNVACVIVDGVVAPMVPGPPGRMERALQTG